MYVGLKKKLRGKWSGYGAPFRSRTACLVPSGGNSEKLIRTVLFLGGIALLGFAFAGDAYAADSNGAITFNSSKVTNSVNAIMLYLEGSFGALVMAAAGIGAITAAAFGGYKASLSLMVVAVGAFILRSLMATFFNCQGIMK